MPELPEVENLRRYLIREGLPGRSFASVTASWAKTVKSPSVEDFVLGLRGRTVRDVHRRAKYLNVELDRGSLVLHMGMTGSLAVRGQGDERQRFAHTIFDLDDGRRIEMNDPRKWASAWLVDDPSSLFEGIGPEPFDASFTAGVFVERVRIKRSPIKSVLLDQSVLAGVGNIYADEALLRAGITPGRRAHRISAARLEALHGEILTVLAHSIDFIEEHPMDDGRPFVTDAHDDRMAITRAKGGSCPVCGVAMSSKVFGGRTAYFCRQCQS